VRETNLLTIVSMSFRGTPRNLAGPLGVTGQTDPLLSDTPWLKIGNSSGTSQPRFGYNLLIDQC